MSNYHFVPIAHLNTLILLQSVSPFTRLVPKSRGAWRLYGSEPQQWWSPEEHGLGACGGQCKCLCQDCVGDCPYVQTLSYCVCMLTSSLLTLIITGIMTISPFVTVALVQTMFLLCSYISTLLNDSPQAWSCVWESVSSFRLSKCVYIHVGLGYAKALMATKLVHYPLNHLCHLCSIFLIYCRSFYCWWMIF